MNVHYTVELANEEREILRALICGGSPRARKVKRALILLLADQGDTQEQMCSQSSSFLGLELRIVRFPVAEHRV